MLQMDEKNQIEPVAHPPVPKKRGRPRKTTIVAPTTLTGTATETRPAETSTQKKSNRVKSSKTAHKTAGIANDRRKKAVGPPMAKTVEIAADSTLAEPAPDSTLAEKEVKSVHQKTKKILFVGSEVMPYAATGGLGDVLGSLPVALRAKYGEDVDVRVVVPLYESIPRQIKDQMKTEAVFHVSLAWRRQYCGVLSLYQNGVTFYFIDNEYYFKRAALYGHFDDGERYAYFCKAVIDMLPHIGFFPDILHANDWQSALAVVYLRTQYSHLPDYSGIHTVFTIHNIEYQGLYDFSILHDVFDLQDDQRGIVEYDGCINLVKAAIVCADRVTTVSPTYAQEIMTPEYAHRLHFVLAQNSAKVSGILNGIDTAYYNPAADQDIPVLYSAESCHLKAENKLAFQREFGLPEASGAPMIAVISRLVAHKGIDLIAAMLRHVLDSHPDAQFVVLGTGERQYESFFGQLEQDYPRQVRAFLTYNRALSKKIYASADIFLMPSRSEPCGLSQMIACRYGAIPIVRETGGLYDSIKPYYEDGEGMHGNGFTFANYHAYELEDRLHAALALYAQPASFATLQYRAMTSDFSWNVSAEKYMNLYNGI